MEDLLYRIFNRKIIIEADGVFYIVKAPTADLRYRAEIYKKNLIHRNKFDLPRLEYYDNFLIQNNFIEMDYKTKIKNMNAAIDNLKVQLYNNRGNLNEIKKIKKNLQIMKDKLLDYHGKIEFFRRQSLEYYAESLKNKYILINTIYYDDQLVFNQDNLDLPLLSQIILEVNKLDISSADFRKIARSEEWRSYWLGNKYNLFGIPAIEFTEDQKMLCMFTRMYDNIYEHPERPDEEIINDDDKLDGWIIIEQEKNKENSKKKLVTDMDPQYTEVFKPAANKESAEFIYNSNTSDGKRILKERAQVLTNKDTVKDQDFIDVRLDMIKSAAEQESKHMKNIGRK